MEITDRKAALTTEPPLQASEQTALRVGSLGVALAVAGIAAVSAPQRRTIPPPLFGVLATLIGVGAVLLAG